jgi:D-3-phosphoglycerate dehydrogenase
VNIGILEPLRFSSKAISVLRKKGNVTFFDGNKGSLETFTKNVHILFIRLNYYIGEDFLSNCKNLKIICSPTTGLNHMDLDVIAKRNIQVISLRNESHFLSNIRATPEHAFGLIISLLRGYKNSFLSNISNSWDREKYFGYEIYKNKFGIIGLGRIGKILASYLSSFGAIVSYYDPKEILLPKGYSFTKKDSIESLIQDSHIILLCASYTPNDNPIINKKTIDAMKNKFFINTSRGELIDEEYLISKINEDHFKGIALDVISNETSRNNNNLLKMVALTEGRNFIITPHIGGATFDSINSTEMFIVEKLLKKLKQTLRKNAK